MLQVRLHLPPEQGHAAEEDGHHPLGAGGGVRAQRPAPGSSQSERSIRAVDQSETEHGRARPDQTSKWSKDKIHELQVKLGT